MNCTIKINYGSKEGEGITISNINDEEIYGKEGFLVDSLHLNLNKILKNSPKWNDFVDKLILYMSSNSAVIKDISYKDIQQQKDLIPNVNSAYIRDTYPDVEFPEINVPILLLDNLDRNNKNGVWGRVIDTKGNEIFVIKGDKNSVIKLGKYLTTRERLSENFIDNLDEDLANELDEVFKALKSDELPTKRDLVSDYLNNKSKYKDVKKEVGKRSALLVLEDISNVLSSIPKLNGDPLLTTFIRSLKSDDTEFDDYYKNTLMVKLPAVAKLLRIDTVEDFNKFRTISNELIKGMFKNLMSKSEFNKLTETEKTFIKDVYLVLNGEQKLKGYGHPLVDEFVARFTYGFNSAKVNLDKYYTRVFKTELPNAMKLLDTNSVEKFISFIGKEGSEVKETLEKAMEDEEYNKLSDLEKSFIERLKFDIDLNEELWVGESFFNWMQSLLGPTTTPIRYKAKKLNKNILLLESHYPTIRSVYGLGYDSLSQFSEVETINGYTIYTGAVNGALAFFFTKGILTPESYGVAYHTLEEAQEAISIKASKDILKNNGLFDLKIRKVNGEFTTREGSTFTSEGYIPSKSIITSIDMPVSTENMLNTEFILLDKTLWDFLNYIRDLNVGIDVKESIINNIDTAEKAAIFLSEVNLRMNKVEANGRITYNRTDAKVFNDIILDIKKAPVKYYFIKGSILTKSEGLRRYYFIETDKTVALQARKSPRIPIIKFLETLASTMLNKFGVPVHVVSNEDIIEATNSKTISTLEAIESRTEAEEEMLTLAKNLQGLELDSTVKAFIHNGEIYINSSTASILDPFHEYAHLILGVLKANPKTRLAYIDILKRALNTEYAAQAIERKRKLYPKRSYYDLAEEVFADMYGAYMNKNLPYNINNLFEDSIELKENENVVFNLKEFDKPLKEYSGKTMKSFWTRFNRDVALTLKDNPSFIKDNGEILMLRRKANWLEKLIKDGKIEEKCE